MRFPVRFETACFVITHDVPEQAMPWFKRARDIFGRLLIFIDARRAVPGAEQRAKEVASFVHPSVSEAFFASDFRAMAAACESDWALYLDYDEELSPEWDDASWRSLIRDGEFTHFFCPRRWILPNSNYITSEPWWPDMQLRLFRTDLPVKYPEKPHEPLAVPGRGALFQKLCIYHHVLWLSDRPAREAKSRYYESLAPGGSLEYFYLYEERKPREASLPPAALLDISRERVTMPRLDPEAVKGIRLSVEDAPTKVAANTIFWVRTLIDNDTEISLSSAPSFPVRLSYHWVDAATGAVEVYDGLRSEVLHPIRPAARQELEMVVYAPSRPGRYRLKVTMVQEQNFWFEQVAGEFGREITVEVI